MKIIKQKKFVIGAMAAIAIFSTVGTVGALNGWFGGNNVPLDTFSRGLVGYWSFDEGNGITSYDASGYANNGTLYYMVTSSDAWTSGKVGSALNFDGVDDYVDMGNSSVFNSDAVSLEVWFKTNTVAPSYQSIVTKSGNAADLDLQLEGSTLKFYIHQSSALSITYSTAIAINNWYHVVITSAGIGASNLKMYVNGIEVTSASPDGTRVTNNNNFQVGQSAVWGGRNFNGLIDEVRIYSRALSTQEVRYHYNRSAPVAQWKFDEGSGSTAYDSTENSNDGVLYGEMASSTISVSGWVSGKQGTALAFDGLDDYTEVADANSLEVTSAITLSAWVNKSSQTLKLLSIYPGGGACSGTGTCYLSTVVSNDGAGLFDAPTCITAGAFNGGTYDPNDYNVVMFDAADCWACAIDAEEKTTLRNYVDEGGGLIASHDSLACGCSYAGSPALGAANSIVDVFGLTAGGYDGSFNTVYRTRTGDITDYPYSLPASMSTYDSHVECGGITVNGATRWYETINPANDSGSDIYLTDYRYANGKTMKMAWGHSGGAPADNSNESKAIINSLYWAAKPRIVDKGDAYGLVMDGDSISGIINSQNVDAALASGWNHVVLTYDGSSQKLYINGELKAEEVLTGAITTNSNNLVIGRNFKGSMDDLKVYNYARTPAEIALDYSAGFGAKFGYANKSCNIDPGSCLTKGLMGYWPFEEGTGVTTYDGSGNNNTGTLTNGPQWATGKVGSALNFDGVDDSVGVVNADGINFERTQPFTISMWLKANSTPADAKNILTKLNEAVGAKGYRLMITTSRTLYFLLADNHTVTDINLTTPTALALGDWYHFVITYDGNGNTNGMALYLNGKLDVSGGAGNLTSTIQNALPLTMGASSNAGRYFDGQIDELRIYNRVLSPEEIRYQYNKGGPVAYWKFDEGTGSAVYDSTKDGNNGTITGATWVTGKSGTALSFDGNDYVSISDSIDLSSANITVSAWINPTDTNNKAIAAKSNTCGGGLDNGWVFELIGGKLATWIYGVTPGWISGDATVPANQFSHVAFKYESGVVTFYINGKLDETIAVTNASLPDNAVPLLIGHQGACNLFTGIIDDFRIYNYARTDEQIRKDYNEGFAAQFGAANSECNQDPGKCMTKGLIGYWNFNEGNGVTAYDGSGNNNTGTLTNGPQWTTGKVGSALEFDGVNDYVDIADNSTVDLSTSFTLSAWVNPDSTDGNHAIIRKDSAYVLYYSSELDFYNWADGTRLSCSKTKAPAGQWSYITAVWDGSKKYIYVNGAECVKESSINFSTNNNDLSIGSQTDGAGMIFDGFIDEVRIYNRALSAEEVSYQYNKGGPVGYWKFSEGEGNTAYDSTDNNNDGSLVGPTWIKGQYGSALSFDGSNDYVNVPYNSSLAPIKITLGAWINMIDKTATGRVISKTETGGYQISVNENSACASNSLCMLVRVGGSYYDAVYPSVNLENNKWYYVSGTYDGETVILYLNGMEVGRDETPSGDISYSQNNPACIGTEPSASACDGGTYFGGKIDDMRVYNYARAPSQIQQDYNAGLSTYFK